MEVLKKLFISLFILLAACDSKPFVDIVYGAELGVQRVSLVSQNSMMKSRNATVRVVSLGEEGFIALGTGTYFKYKNKYFILTAAHVVSRSSEAVVSTDTELANSQVIYIDEQRDLAILSIGELKSKKAILWNLSKVYYGQDVVYTGFPNGYSNLSIKGYVCGVTVNRIILHSYAWGGSSGSAVLDDKGRIVGVVSAIDVGEGIVGIPQVVEDVVIVAPVSNLDLENILKN